ncbi:hypothetical protein MIDIC_410001 [Alphaproteobacteria bacterium]
MQENKDSITIGLVKSILDGNILAKLAFDEMYKNSEGLVLTNVQILENEKLKSEFIAAGATDGAVAKISANHWLNSGAFTEMWHKYQPEIMTLSIVNCIKGLLKDEIKGIIHVGGQDK